MNKYIGIRLWSYRSLLQIFACLSSPRNPQVGKGSTLKPETQKLTSKCDETSLLDIPTYIRQGRILSISCIN
jgi:hypothetical protein